MLDPSGLASFTNSIIHTISTSVGINTSKESRTTELKALSEPKKGNGKKSLIAEDTSFKLKERLLEAISILDTLKKHDSILSSKAKIIADRSKIYSDYYNTTVARFNRDDLSNNTFTTNNDSIISFEIDSHQCNCK